MRARAAGILGLTGCCVGPPNRLRKGDSWCHNMLSDPAYVGVVWERRYAHDAAGPTPGHGCSCSHAHGARSSSTTSCGLGFLHRRRSFGAAFSHGKEKHRQKGTFTSTLVGNHLFSDIQFFWVGLRRRAPEHTPSSVLSEQRDLVVTGHGRPDPVGVMSTPRRLH